MKITARILIFWCLSTLSFAQAVNSDLITDFEDIAGLKVTDIKQDKTGFLWVGTNEGLYRYDGYTFKLYEPKEKTLGSSIINTIYIDSKDEMWIGTRGGLLQYSETADQVISFIHNADNPETIGNNIVNSIIEDKMHDLWIAFSKGGLGLFKRKENVFYHFKQGDGSGLAADDISDVHIDKDDNLWVSTWHFGLNKLDLKNPSNHIPANVKFSSYPVVETFHRDVILDFIYEDVGLGKIYVGTNGNGLYEYDPTNNRFTLLNLPLASATLYNATSYSPDRILLSTDNKIQLVNLKESRIEQCPAPLNKIVGEIVNCVFIDKQNTIWVGGENGLKRNVEKKINHYKLDETKNFAPINNVTALCKHNQYLWIGAWGDGLYLRDEKNGRMIRVNENNDLLEAIWDLKLINDNQTLLISTHKGLATLNLANMNFSPTFPEKNFRSSVNFTSFSTNTKGTTWVGAWDGSIYTVDYQTGEIKKFTGFHAEKELFQCVLLDRNNSLWIGTRFSGLIHLSNINGIVKSSLYSQRAEPPYQISNDIVLALHEDEKGRIWVGTDGGGISIINTSRDSITWILKGEQNFPSNTVKGFIEDRDGNIWVSFKRGISRYDPNNGFINYTDDDGLEYLNFNIGAVTRSDSTLYFGNQSGYNTFRPTDLEFKERNPVVFITDLKINNQPYGAAALEEFGSTAKSSLNDLKNFTLNYKASTISFEFSTLDFTNPKREIYAYKLEGVSNDWTYTNASNRRINYSNLTPGQYVFKVKVVRNNTGDDQTKTITINITPPFWQTLWFKIGTVLAFIALLYSAHRIRLERISKQKIKFEKLADERIRVIEKKNVEIQNQQARLHEADKSKLEFFTNISHEFRTPLMLIIGPLTSLRNKFNANGENEKLTLIERNAQRLLRLMDQIMDLTKIDAGSAKVILEEGDLVKFIKDVGSSFDYLADTKKIQFELKSSFDEFVCNFDHDKIEKILYNLLSNAFKVTPQYGLVTIVLDINDRKDSSGKQLNMEISNTGIGIPKEDLMNLFTRFYRTKSYRDGTGIGLALTKSFIELQGGSIEVKSEEKVGSSFYITLPLNTTPLIKESFEPYLKKLTNQSINYSHDSADVSAIKMSADPNAKSVMIVEDDEDMRTYISGLLELTYNVIRSGNGEEAVKFAYEYQPDLIISDMMMPGMDGYEFMRAIKKDSNVSHIPIILLTGKDGVDARLQGLEEGADDYITKPFNEKILLARVKNLIEQRKLMKERFSTDLQMKPAEMTITSVDEKFMKNLISLVEAHIADPEFNAEVICQELGIGRSYLYSKVKAITDLSVNEFIKTMRLKRAAALLTTTHQNVNEVAVSVGFNDRSHFSKSFTKQFGMAPAQYQKEREKT